MGLCILTEALDGMLLISSIRLELEASMVATLGSKEEIACLEDVDDSARWQSVKELYPQRVHI